MDNTRIIPVKFGKERLVVTEYRMQHDWGQVLDFIDIVLPEAFEARFSNSITGQSVGQIGYNNQVRIPKQFFESGEPIYCYVTVHDEETDGRTLYTTKVPIKPSSERTEEEPEPEEESIITQAITALNTAVDVTSQKALEASESADRAEHAADGIEAYVERAEAAQQASESARDRAVQAETNSSASASIASEKASEAYNYADVANKAYIATERYASIAEGEAGEAKRYAEASAESASQANGYASTAGSKATEASGYASNANISAETASQKASEAAQSASTASQAKTDAETAKTASQTAQGLAESARDGAITAKTDAESARDEAQEIVDGITGKVEQIDSNTDRIESLEGDRYKPYPTDFASGAVASFPDGADNIPFKSCIVRIDPVQAGSGDPSPDNVRPISGWTGMQIQHTGKNLLDSSTLLSGAYSDADFNIPSSSSAIYRSIKIFLKAGTYTLFTSVNVDVVRTLIDGGFSSSTYGNLRSHTFTSNTNGYVGLTVRRYDRGDWDSATTLQLELGSTATDYVPYKGRTYPITFPTEAGTVYGGYVDVTGGELVVDRYYGTIDNKKVNISINSKGYFWYTTFYDLSYPYIKSDNAKLIVNRLRMIVNTKETDPDGVMSIYGNGIIRWKEKGEMTLDDYKAYLTDNPLYFCYEVKEPTHYPLTPTEIKTLLGQNNIWADCGDTEVEYRADTTLYISRLTEPDADMIADSNITSGSYFMVGNNLYRATVNIASGASVIVGTNAVKISLAQALNEINA